MSLAIDWTPAEGVEIDLLTVEERAAFDLLTDAHEAYAHLPDHSFSALDVEPWTRAMNLLQMQLMARAARRAYPKAFVPWDRP